MQVDAAGPDDGTGSWEKEGGRRLEEEEGLAGPGGGELGDMVALGGNPFSYFSRARGSCAKGNRGLECRVRETPEGQSELFNSRVVSANADNLAAIGFDGSHVLFGVWDI